MESLIERVPGRIYVVMTGPPGPFGEFIEVEDHEGRSINVGRWVELPGSLPGSPIRYALELDDPRFPPSPDGESEDEFLEYAISALGAKEGMHGEWLVSGPHSKRLYWILRAHQQRRQVRG